MESLPDNYNPQQATEVTRIGNKQQVTEGGHGTFRMANSTEAKADAVVKNSFTEQSLIEGSHVTVVSHDNAEYLHLAVDDGTRQQAEGGQNIAKNAGKVVHNSQEAIMDYDDDVSEDVVLQAPGSYDDMPLKQQGSTVQSAGKGKEELEELEELVLDADDESSEDVVLQAPGSYDSVQERPSVRTDESKKTAQAMREERKPIETGEPDALGKAAPQSRVHSGLKGVYMGIKQGFNNYIQRQRVEKAGDNITENVLKSLVRDCSGSNTKLKALGNALQGRAEQIGNEKVEALLQGKIPSWTPTEQPKDTSSELEKMRIGKALSDIDDALFSSGFDLDEKGVDDFMKLIREGQSLGLTDLDESKTNSLQSICERWSTRVSWADGKKLPLENRLELAKIYAENALNQLETRVNKQFTPIAELRGAMKTVLEQLNHNTKLSEDGNTIRHDWSRQLNAYRDAERSRTTLKKLQAAQDLPTPEEIVNSFDFEKNPVFANMHKKVSNAAILVVEQKPTGKFARDVFKLYVGDNEQQKNAIDDFIKKNDLMGLNKYMMDLVKERSSSK